MSYRQIVSAIAVELERRHLKTDAETDMQLHAGLESVVDEIVECQRNMPDYLRAPMWILTQVFDLAGLFSGGSRFRKLLPAQQTAQVDAWRNSRLEFCRNFVRFYESLFLLIVLQEEIT